MFGIDLILGMKSLRFEPLRGTRVHAPAGIHKGKCKTGQYASSRYGIGKDIAANSGKERHLVTNSGKKR